MAKSAVATLRLCSPNGVLATDLEPGSYHWRHHLRGPSGGMSFHDFLACFQVCGAQHVVFSKVVLINDDVRINREILLLIEHQMPGECKVAW
jgi:hypothetical protein